MNPLIPQQRSLLLAWIVVLSLSPEGCFPLFGDPILIGTAAGRMGCTTDSVKTTRVADPLDQAIPDSETYEINGCGPPIRFTCYEGARIVMSYNGQRPNSWTRHCEPHAEVAERDVQKSAARDLDCLSEVALTRVPNPRGAVLQFTSEQTEPRTFEASACGKRALYSCKVPRDLHVSSSVCIPLSVASWDSWFASAGSLCDDTSHLAPCAKACAAADMASCLGLGRLLEGRSGPSADDSAGPPCTRGQEACDAERLFDGIDPLNLYRRACNGGVADACGEAKRLVASRDEGERACGSALVECEARCDHGNIGSCRGLTRVLARGEASNVERAIHFGVLACNRGDAQSCLLAGDLRARSDRQASMPLYATACTAGVEAACRAIVNLIDARSVVPTRSSLREALNALCQLGRQAACARAKQLP
jgi:hypothetical protein